MYAAVRSALASIQAEPGDDEWRLNDKLFEQLLDSINHIDPQGEIFLAMPFRDAPRHPVHGESMLEASLQKRPDIQWVVRSSFFPLCRSLVIECKRLDATKLLSKLYVTKGVRRFESPDFCYGKDEDSAMMIGYLMDGEPTRVVELVNESLTEEAIRELILLPQDAEWDGVQEMTQQLLRRLNPQMFLLRHWWVDMRSQVGAATA